MKSVKQMLNTRHEIEWILLHGYCAIPVYVIAGISSKHAPLNEVLSDKQKKTLVFV